MYKLEFTLKQHTPLIHFQHDQAGATLRATEVKPKLDQFIIEKLLEEQNIRFDYYEPQTDGTKKFINAHETFKRKALKPEDKIQKEWLFWLAGKGKNEHVSLDYKITIVSVDTSIKVISEDDKIPMYFGNMGDEYLEKPMSLITCNKLKISLLCLNDLLRSTIKKLFPYFIARSNFGTRQNKGYGSFFFHEDDENGFFTIDHYLKGNYCLRIRQNDWRNSLFVINYYYQRLKSGVNYYYKDRNTGKAFTHYRPSFFRDFMYMNQTVQWEKPWLKQKFFPVTGVLNNPKFARAFLGLSPRFEFKNKPNPSNPNPATYPRFDFGVDVTSETISRHKSPITFKPIMTERGAEIYVLVERRFWEPICNQPFKFEGNGKAVDIYTPANGIDTNLLIDEYNKNLGTSFTAVDFKGVKSINVSITIQS
ncbi:MAG TPA: hypothetical protein PK335_11330 [Draconibacterium sp.]|nr:hypothetical protein [Draconibacterium sp.]